MLACLPLQRFQKQPVHLLGRDLMPKKKEDIISSSYLSSHLESPAQKHNHCQGLRPEKSPSPECLLKSLRSRTVNHRSGRDTSTRVWLPPRCQGGPGAGVRAGGGDTPGSRSVYNPEKNSGPSRYEDSCLLRVLCSIPLLQESFWVSLCRGS